MSATFQVMEIDDQPLVVPTKRIRFSATKRYLVLLLVVLVLGAITLSIALPLCLTGTKKSTSPSNEGQYAHAAVAADSALCSTLGRRAMQELGGNAVDAAVATTLCLGVVHPQSSGIGGGGFLVIYNRSTGQAESFNFREAAPTGAYEMMLLDQNEKPGVVVGVPGEVKMLEEIWQKYGQADWKSLFDMAAEVADGFEVNSPLASAIASVKEKLDEDPRFSSLKDLVAPDGVYLREGDTMKRPLLAQTLRAIGASGSSDIFYKSDWTSTMVQEINELGGGFTYDDFALYETPSGSALQGEFMDMTVYGMKPPASGVVHQLMLNILSGYDMTADDFGLLSYQRTIETFKFAYGQRNKLGDPVFEPDVEDLVDVMMNPATANEMRAKIMDDATFPPEYYEGNYSLPDEHGTTHFSVIDSDGNAVALTTTVNTYFGSKIHSPTLGLIYNDEMRDFSTPNTTDVWDLPPNPRNFVKPGKRPLSSTCPSVLVDSNGDVAMAIGAAGGSRITPAVALAVTKFYIFQKTLLESIDPPRPHHQLIPNVVFIENSFPDEYADGLRDIGHQVNLTSSGAVVQGIVRDPNTKELTAVCDIRKDGEPDGF
ncbi:glutathione hydrolase 1 proenzyme-like [Oscarella lobularis]|uniref:glutathione hydrolase 1 proenzyme-like n=1 Tax=Oscarella lobularis TaxID=121494 RepID=UPI0033133775